MIQKITKIRIFRFIIRVIIVISIAWYVLFSGFFIKYFCIIFGNQFSVIEFFIFSGMAFILWVFILFWLCFIEDYFEKEIKEK